MSQQCRTTGKHILLADDQQDVRNTIKLLLRMDEHTVTEASNGREALERFREGRFDLVITDYSMPEMRGDELAANVKHLAPSQPVLMLSGTAELLGGLGMPADAFLGKPFTLVDLREAIARLC